MDFDPYSEMAEEAAFENAYADEMEMLNDMESAPEMKSSQSRRRLFETAEPSTSAIQDSSFIDFLESDLQIDEKDENDLMPKPKRSKMDFWSAKSHKLPTTLDDDFDVIQKKREAGGIVGDSDKMIQKILDFRNRKNREAEEFLESSNSKAHTKGLKIRKVLQYPPVHNEFISATSSDGQRCYMRIRGDRNLTSTNNAISLPQGGTLLTQSVSEMRQEIQEAMDRKVQQDTQTLVQSVRGKYLDGNKNHRSHEGPESENFDSFHDAQKFGDFVDDSQVDSLGKSSEKELWLDKFAPTQYSHLLSEENVNRSLLKWLKMWDFVVFGRKVKKKEKPTQTDMNQKKFPYFRKWEFDDRTDEYERPFYKAALLHGPPGLGKTTLAHIIAKHAGYHVVEMNASDDRSADVFRNKLEQTTQMKSVLGQDERPNCLIIDEIDGAPQAAIDVLLNAINKVRHKDDKKGGKSKKRGANNILLRPIICICNDLYVPALRQLRQQSFVVNFPPTRPAILASRLAQLCRIQQLQCDITTLLKLCEKTDSDIRSCVNTLQFVKASGQGKLNPTTVVAFQIGQKDQHKSLFKVWQEIFQLPRNKSMTEKQQHLNSHNLADSTTSIATRFYNIHHLVAANGEYEKAFQGVYENYLKMKFKDHNLACVIKAHEWIEFYDRLAYINLHFQDWSVMKFYPYLFVLFHMLFSCNNVPKITFPTQSYENAKKSQKSENLLKGMFMEMLPDVRCYSTPHIAVTDSIPYILSIISPIIRPVNSQLYNPTEKKVLQGLVSAMVSYHLSYKQIRDEDGRYDYVLEPGVNDICEFAETQNKIRLPYSTRQLISKEVEMEKMRRLERAIYNNAIANVQNDMKKPPLHDKVSASNKSASNPSKSEKREVKTLEKTLSQAQVPADKPVIDFFSRFTKTKKVVTISTSETTKKAPVRDPGIGNSQIWYKFNEGYSNAVRQTVYVKDFL